MLISRLKVGQREKLDIKIEETFASYRTFSCFSMKCLIFLGKLFGNLMLTFGGFGESK